MIDQPPKMLRLFAVVGLAVSTGCEQPAPAPPAAETVEASGNSHSGWWCDEHGVPEGICTRCDSSLVADFKAKDDWCKEHELPDSQCFVCHPELEAKFAAQYEAKYGKQPPKPTDAGEHGHDHEHDHADDHKHDEKS